MPRAQAKKLFPAPVAPLIKAFSALITSQIPINLWHEIIGEQTIADAILDRIVHDSERVELKGESMRKKRIILPEETTENNN